MNANKPPERTATRSAGDRRSTVRRPGARFSVLARLLPILVAGASLHTATALRAQEMPQQIAIALYAPSVHFEDSVARAGFIGALASRLETELGVSVQGQNVSSPDALGGTDLAVVDGIYFAANPSGTPLASARAEFGTNGPLALLVASSELRRLSDLRGRTLILPRGAANLEDFVTGSVLHGEISAEEFFGEIEYTANIESALSAVEQGRADVTLGFAAYAGMGGLQAVDSYEEAPMPVLVQLNDGLETALIERIEQTVRGFTSDQSIRGFTSYDSEPISSFRRRCSTSAPERTVLMTRPRMVTMEVSEIDLPEVEEPLPLGSPADLLDVPPMEEP